MNTPLSREDILRRLGEALPGLSRRYAVTSVRVFGSAARDELDAFSDVDLLVEFATPPGLVAFMRLKHEREGVLGRTVDIATPRALKPRIRPTVEREAIRVTGLPPVP